MNFSEITITPRYGYAIASIGTDGPAMVCEPTMAGPDIMAFVIIERCDDYETANLVAFMLHESGETPRTYGEEVDHAAETTGSDAPDIPQVLALEAAATSPAAADE